MYEYNNVDDRISDWEAYSHRLESSIWWLYRAIRAWQPLIPAEVSHQWQPWIQFDPQEHFPRSLNSPSHAQQPALSRSPSPAPDRLQLVFYEPQQSGLPACPSQPSRWEVQLVKFLSEIPRAVDWKADITALDSAVNTLLEGPLPVTLIERQGETPRPSGG
jgi:hypothetical protein